MYQEWMYYCTFFDIEIRSFNPTDTTCLAGSKIPAMLNRCIFCHVNYLSGQDPFSSVLRHHS